LKVLAAIDRDINMEIILIPNEEWTFLFVFFAVNVMSIQSTEPRSVLQFTIAAVKCVIDFIIHQHLQQIFTLS